MIENSCYAGKILTVDLSKKEGKRQKMGDSFALKYLGGDGFGAYFLNKLVPGDADALGKDNVLVMVPGTLVGTVVPTAGKTGFYAKSPLTGGWGEGVMGGRIGFALKQAGYDALIITGIAEEPSYLLIDNDEVMVKSASHLWGKSTRETAEEIKKDEGDVIVASIGPGGERKVRYAVIDSDERQAGRGGLGAVMGSKNLKAIAVRGSRDIKVADPKKMMELFDKWYHTMIESPAFNDDGKYGTGEFLEWMNAERGTFPTRNWREGVF
ncbi:MAG TPA: aldehyde:ferredoxin oxidoreductase, partial [Thermoplasmatales archaeon]|nr:aldehyde:ferredoxin oxidoreductase [Thermoplasmatales archaeon]